MNKFNKSKKNKMAFVFKADRDISPELNNATGDIGPGQYLPQGFINTKIKNSKAGFDSNTFRDVKISKNDVPGPGSYTYDDKYEKLIHLFAEKNSKSPSMLKSLEMVGPDNLDPFTIVINKERPKDVAFYSKEKRFKEKLGYDFPGPGQYGNFDPKLFVRNSIRKKKKKNNSKGRKNSANSLIRKDKSPLSPFRIATIPSKNFCYGFDVNQEGELYVKDDPDKDIRFSGDVKNSVGPGNYEIDNNKIWNKNLVPWEKLSKSNRNLPFESSENQKNKTISITYTHSNTNSNYNNYLNSPHNFFSPTNKKQSTILNISNGYVFSNIQSPNHNFIQTKNEVLISNQKQKYEKDKIFKHIRDKRQKLLEIKISKGNFEDELFNKHILNQEPGPGYYSPENVKDSFKQFKVPEKFQHFGSNSLRFSDPNLTEQHSDVGPGAYFRDDQKLAKKKMKNFLKDQNFSSNIQGHREDIKKERFETLEARIGINGIINQHKLANLEFTPGPGDYQTQNENLVKRSFSNLSLFGSLEKRFNDNIPNPTPGPGSYIGMPKVESVNHVKFPTRPKKIIVKKEENLQPDLSIFPKEEMEEIIPCTTSPGVGTYSPEVVVSLGYKVAKNVHKFNNSSAPFNTMERRFQDKNKNSVTENVGPGIYYKDQTEKKLMMNLIHNSPPFNTSAERKYTNEDRNIPGDSGPGSYNLNSYFDWNKKSFNVQFI